MVEGLGDMLAPEELGPGSVERVNVYHSTPATGSPLHFDVRTIVIVMLSGQKVWQVSSRPALAEPRRNTVADEAQGRAEHGGEHLRLPDHMHFCALQPGDWLMIPRGTWHGTFSLHGSLSATLALADDASLDALMDNGTVPPTGERMRC